MWHNKTSELSWGFVGIRQLWLLGLRKSLDVLLCKSLEYSKI